MRPTLLYIFLIPHTLYKTNVLVAIVLLNILINFEEFLYYQKNYLIR